MPTRAEASRMTMVWFHGEYVGMSIDQPLGWGRGGRAEYDLQPRAGQRVDRPIQPIKVENPLARFQA